MESLAKELGVKFQTNANIEKIVENKTAVAIQVNDDSSDLILSGADYHHETLLSRNTERIQKNTGIVGFAPSSLLFYVGFKKNR
jgi:phytoene desaturase